MDEKNSYKTLRIASVRQDNYRVKTFTLDGKLDARPGQFCMVWIPRLNEKPFSIMNADPLTFNIAAVGEFSNRLHELKEGDKITLRGPYGNGFTRNGKEKKVLLVGGGYGVAPLYFFAKQCLAQKIEPVMVIGARNEKDVLLEKEFTDAGVRVIVATDDGSKGVTGFATVAAQAELGSGGVDAVYACGPEKMMTALARVCKDKQIPCQVSLERYMGCGMGICGKCVCGGQRVCADGPIFNGEEALKTGDFGQKSRDASGTAKTL